MVKKGMMGLEMKVFKSLHKGLSRLSVTWCRILSEKTDTVFYLAFVFLDIVL